MGEFLLDREDCLHDNVLNLSHKFLRVLVLRLQAGKYFVEGSLVAFLVVHILRHDEIVVFLVDSVICKVNA